MSDKLPLLLFNKKPLLCLLMLLFAKAIVAEEMTTEDVLNSLKMLPVSEVQPLVMRQNSDDYKVIAIPESPSRAPLMAAPRPDSRNALPHAEFNVESVLKNTADNQFPIQAESDSKITVDVSAAAQTENLVQNPYTGSMVPDRGKRLFLIQRLLELALQNSPEIRDAEASWYAAEMDLAAAKGVKWPRIDLTGTSAAKQFGAGNPYGNGVTGRAGVTATYTLIDGGKSSHQIASKAHLERAARAKYFLARNKIAVDALNAYLQIAKYQLLISAYQAHLDRMQSLSEKLRGIVAELPGRRSELTQAKARVMQAQENLDSANSKKREFQLQLIKLIGTKIKINEITDFEVDIPALSLEEAMKRAESHPALVSADAELDAAKEMISVAKAEDLPQLDLQASRMSGHDVMGYPDPGQIYVAAKWNVFQGFASRAAEKASQARVFSAEEKRLQAINEIEFRLNSSWADYQTQKIRIGNMELLKKESWQVRDDYYIQWKDLGRRTLLELLAAESEYLNSEIGLITSKIDCSVAAAKLYAESGMMADWLIGDLWTMDLLKD